MGFRSCGFPLADQRKRTESVSPPSNSPDRPSPKRLPGGRAFNLRRSVLGALGNLLAHLADVKHSFERMCRKLRQSSLSRHSLEKFGPRKSAPRAGAPSSGLPTDRRRSDCLSEGHQPQALRPRCTRDTTARSSRRQVGTDRENSHVAVFSFRIASACVSTHVLWRGKDHGFAEPGALSSTSPADLPLPRTASREGFVLVASRARRSGNLRLSEGPCKGIRQRKPRKLRTREVT